MKTLIITIIIMFTVVLGLQGQQDAQYTQYMYNTLTVNPAYAGSRGVFSVNFLHRSQWVGLDGAPTTQTLNLHSPVSKSVGLGLSIVNDEIGNGTNQDTYFDGVFSYTIRTAGQGKISFGLKAGGHLLNIDFNKLQNYGAGSSAAAPVNIDNKFSPNFGAGIYYHTDTFYAGFSIPNFLETEHFERSGTSGSSSFLAQERMNYYFILGNVFTLNNYWKVKPAGLLKVVQGAPLQVDLSSTFLYRDRLSLGVAYRWSAAVSALVGMQVTDQFMIGLSYDKETTELGNTSFNDGSFELFLRYEFRNKVQKVLTPRFF